MWEWGFLNQLFILYIKAQSYAPCGAVFSSPSLLPLSWPPSSGEDGVGSLCPPHLEGVIRAAFLALQGVPQGDLKFYGAETKPGDLMEHKGWFQLLCRGIGEATRPLEIRKHCGGCAGSAGGRWAQPLGAPWLASWETFAAGEERRALLPPTEPCF